MVNEPNERGTQLARWILELVEILRIRGGSTWATLVDTVSGKTAAIAVDDTELWLRAEGGEELQVEASARTDSAPLNFSTDGDTLKDIIAARISLDAAVSAGDLDVRGELEDVLKIHAVAVEILADSAIDPQLQSLWAEFELEWPLRTPSACRPLESQKPDYGFLIARVPEDVLLTDLDRYASGDA
ncbi:SCP2 sterol-binding domain-containing protein [Phormidium sp. CCY1219]|uniref:SCP2 sterol-binding domain-containing protein n=1 Tax=Phormidium sp. CCY1219 TaxID=2886104 RepID=UPI002D1F0FB1|nr:hypothetical protein [Phormidium sp. CCY1219]MEB3827060.1 hypothetical protein [Phormidium sp. CCY1219]